MTTTQSRSRRYKSLNLYDRVRVIRALEAAGYPADDILVTLEAAGIHLSIDYEQPRTHIIGVEHE